MRPLCQRRRDDQVGPQQVRKELDVKIAVFTDWPKTRWVMIRERDLDLGDDEKMVGVAADQSAGGVQVDPRELRVSRNVCVAVSTC